MTVTLNLPNEGKDWLKLAGGVAAGIGTVAALPIFGPIGTVTALGAVLGGLAGAGSQLLDTEDDDTGNAASSTPSENSIDDMAVPIRQNLFASVRSAADYDRAINLLHVVGAWAAAKAEGTAIPLLTRLQLEILFGDGSASEFRQQNTAVYDNPPDTDQLKECLSQAFADGIDRDSFLTAAVAMLLWLNQEIHLPTQDMPPL